ncbi:MAG: cupin domain-containing protein [Theionarchaea archaeon]|nr:MAG: cupin [Theionarchaea archaeon DG-70]MBU7010319.1 cupin domain-containing protein [Theionarchaea archaeon]
MKVFDYTDIPAQKAEEGAKNTTIRWLITKDIGAETFAMRYFEMDVGGYSPYHIHDWEHEVFILEGEGVIKSEEGDIPFNAGSAVFIPANERHQFRNTGSNPVKFLCLIPYKG